MPARPVGGRGQGRSRRRRGRAAPALSPADHRATSQQHSCSPRSTGRGNAAERTGLSRPTVGAAKTVYCVRPVHPVAPSGKRRGRADMTARVPMVSLERARDVGEAMGMPARRTQSEAFRTVANNPGVARVAFGQLMQLLENNKFDTRLRELMIMRIGWVTGSAYEWTNHWRVATTAGIPPEDVLAVRDWRNSGRLNAADKAILAATDECLAGKSISDAAWAEVAKHVADPGQQVEFIIAMGNWMMFSLLFRNLRIPLAEGVVVWPPDGLASPAAEG